MDRISLGFSSCPNDTFIFDALVHQKVDTEGLDFEVVMEDVEALNLKAFDRVLDVTKLSYHALAYVQDKYVLLDSGSALGRGCGPLLIAKHEMSLEELMGKKVVVPGKYTTANFLFSMACRAEVEKVIKVFSEIEDMVLEGEVEAGVIIHENRFTYESKGLTKIVDLGEFWEDKTGMPIPLGGIVVRSDLDTEIQKKIQRSLKRSIQYAFDNPEDSNDYVRQHAQEMSEDAIEKHIGLYVNDFSVSLGEEGKAAVHYLLDEAKKLGTVANVNHKIITG